MWKTLISVFFKLILFILFNKNKVFYNFYL